MPKSTSNVSSNSAPSIVYNSTHCLKTPKKSGLVLNTIITGGKINVITMLFSKSSFKGRGNQKYFLQ